MEESYAQQEAKATGREAKVRWAREEGVSVQSIQHDCVVLVVGRVGPDGRRPMRNTLEGGRPGGGDVSLAW